jgi:PQQ-dependent catabolism-associated CXXCW motif protein
MRYFLVIAFLLPLGVAFAQVPFPAVSQPTAYSYEDKDWQVEPTTSLKQPPYHAPTPVSIPGGRVIKTVELKALLEANKDVVVVDVLDSKTRTTVPGAYWISGAGDARFYAAEKDRFAKALEKLTGGDKNRPLVFLCLNSECWLSYNASLHAMEAGYKDVIWYRGGSDAWQGANLDRKKPQAVSW